MDRVNRPATGIATAPPAADAGTAASPRAPLFDGPGELRALCRETDWARTPLGPPDGWTTSLRTVVGLVLASPAAMVVLWGEDLVQVYNDGYRDVMGGKHPAGLGQPTRDCWPEVWAFNAPLYEGVTRRRESYTFTDQRLVLDRTEDAEEAFFTLTYSPVPDDDGSVGGVLVTVFETTGQVRARDLRHLEREQLLRDAEAARDAAERAAAEAAESEARYRTLFESIDEGFCVLEMIFDDEGTPVDYRFLETNPAFEAQTGLHGAAGHTARELVPALEGHWFEIYGRVAITGEPVRFQNGSDPMGRWFDVYALRVGRPADRRVALLFTDVTEARASAREREQLLEELRTQREQLRSVIRQMPAPLALLVGAEHRYGIVNTAYQRVSGGGRDVTGLTVREAFPEMEGQGIHERLDEVYRTGRPWARPETRLRYDRHGEGPVDAWFDLHFEPLRNSDGEVEAILNFAVEVTDQVLARREVERLLAESEAARADAEAANRAKAEFLAVMSHELRTPLNAISGYTDLLEMGIHGAVTPEQRKALGRIQISQQHLLGLINEVLNYAKLESGSVQYEIAAVALGDVLATIEGLVEPQARARGLELAVDDVPADLAVLADPEKLRQIMVNLLSNAIKFTDPGGQVRLRCGRGGERVWLEVHDTGIGIAADRLDSIFEPFVQVRADLTRTAAGTGLGLAISRDLARGMGGELSARSTPGEGSVFTVTLPAPDGA